MQYNRYISRDVAFLVFTIYEGGDCEQSGYKISPQLISVSSSFCPCKHAAMGIDDVTAE